MPILTSVICVHDSINISSFGGMAEKKKITKKDSSVRTVTSKENVIHQRKSVIFYTSTF
jgi:hypothetical protein